jgi:hypothetical protein
MRWNVHNSDLVFYFSPYRCHDWSVTVKFAKGFVV